MIEDIIFITVPHGFDDLNTMVTRKYGLSQIYVLVCHMARPQEILTDLTFYACNFPQRDLEPLMHLSIFCPPGGGGGHTRGFRQKTIPDRREFDKLMESGSRVI